MAEFLGMLRALEAMPDGWSGTMCSDSGVTIGRFGSGWRLKNIPLEWEYRMNRVRTRLGDVVYALHKGHPTAADLERGYGRRSPTAASLLVSEHQVNCDRFCGAAIRRWAEEKGLVKP